MPLLLTQKHLHSVAALTGVLCVCLGVPFRFACGFDDPATVQTRAPDDISAQSTAVALNYCRGSFHRLRQNSSKRVWFEEQHHILNNLNLNEIGDQEVISLYSAVLDEIGKERIADRERVVLRKTYKNQIDRQFLSTAFVLGAEVTTAQYVNAIRTGCNSWWDYRNTSQSRDLDLWKVEKTRMTEVNEKTTRFLETFWKMAQKKNIPDHWLVRNDDLEKLESALLEQNPEVRLRVLQRMDKFMSCYPPYYYHVARTQQVMGNWVAAEQTYEKLARIGAGHFRKDDMLAAGLANLALIQVYTKNSNAVRTARRALEFSTGVWQANLVCARILEQNGELIESEDAILCNLDVDLERPQSLGSLLTLYQKTRQDSKLMSLLSDPKAITEIPALPLIQTAAKIGVQRLPPIAFRQLVTSIYAYDQTGFGQTQLVLVASPAWNLESGEPVLIGKQEATPVSRGRSSCGQTQLSYSPYGAMRMTPGGEPEIVMEVRYPEGDPVRLRLRRRQWSEEMMEHVECQTGRATEIQDLFSMFTDNRRRTSFVITEAEMGSHRVAFWDRSDLRRDDRDPILVDKRRRENIESPTRVNKPAIPVTIEEIVPVAPLELETKAKEKIPEIEPETPEPIQRESKKTTPRGPAPGLFVPVPSRRPGLIFLSDEIEPIDD